YKLAAELRSGVEEQSPKDAGNKSGQDSREEDDSKTSDSGSGESEDSYYTVKKNDTLYSIAKNHGMKLETLLEENGLNENSVISPGDRLKVSP
ncbi:MAG: LysM peptidoglycan-binding domain-containing protein, partial [Desulfosalsimonas sp.]